MGKCPCIKGNTCLTRVGYMIHRRLKLSSRAFPPFALSRVVSLVSVSLIDILSLSGRRLVRRWSTKPSGNVGISSTACAVFVKTGNFAPSQ